MQYRVCEYCGAHLDPGEKCDCRSDRERQAAQKAGTLEQYLKMVKVEKSGQLKMAV